MFLVLVQIFFGKRSAVGLFLQGNAGAVFSQVPLSVLPGACSVHSMAFFWPPPSPVLCALLGLHDFLAFPTWY